MFWAKVTLNGQLIFNDIQHPAIPAEYAGMAGFN
jgi:hypothetical protein